MTTPAYRRRHESLVSALERRALVALAGRLPRAVRPDHLTALGVAGAALVFAGYVASGAHPGWLWLANLGLALHWAGDSLDGTLARLRGIERPRYGFFVDQTVDVGTNFVMALGVGLSPFARLDLTLLVLAGYLMVNLYVLIRNAVTGEFLVSMAGLGPTELRIGMVLMNLGILAFGAPHFVLVGQTMNWCDILLVLTTLLLLGLFSAGFAIDALRLAREDPPRR